MQWFFTKDKTPHFGPLLAKNFKITSLCYSNANVMQKIRKSLNLVQVKTSGQTVSILQDLTLRVQNKVENRDNDIEKSV